MDSMDGCFEQVVQSCTVWAVDFETPVGSSTLFSFIIFLGQHPQNYQPFVIKNNTK
jgi:hypothetical protein